VLGIQKISFIDREPSTTDIVKQATTKIINPYHHCPVLGIQQISFIDRKPPTAGKINKQQ